MKSLKKLKQEACDYFDSIKICPDGQDITDYVASVIEDESGVDLDDEQFKKLAKKLKVSLDI